MRYLVAFLGALSLAALVFLTGWTAWSLFHRRMLENSEPGDFGNVFFSQVASGVALTGIAALVLALTGAFTALTLALADLGLAALALIAWRPRAPALKKSLKAIWPSLKASAPLVPVIVIALLLFLPPFMETFGSWDVGGLVNIAGNISRTGSVFYTDPILRGMDPETRDLFYEKIYRLEPDGGREYKYTTLDPGFYISDMSEGRVTPQFFYYFPAWLAVGMSFLGVRPGFLVHIFFAAMSLWAFYLLAREFMGRLATLAATLFLAVNVLEVFFAKYSTSEMLVQFLFVAGLLAFVTYSRRGEDSDERHWWGFLAGLFFGCLILAHIEGFLLLVPLFLLYMGYYAWSGLERVRRDHVFLLTFATLALIGIALAAGPYHFYSSDILTEVIASVPAGWWLLGAGAGALVILSIAARRSNGARRWVSDNRRLLLAVLCALLVVAFLYALVLRPLLSPQRGLPPEERAYYESALPRLTYYVTPVGMVLAAIGLVLFLLRELDEENAIIPLAGLFFTAVLTYRLFVWPILIISMRRFVPETLPLVALMEGYALTRIYGWARDSSGGYRRKVVAAGAACAAISVVLVSLSLWSSLRIARVDGFSGSYPLAVEVSRMAPGDSVIVLDEKSGRMLAAPLRFFLGREVVRMNDDTSAAGQAFEKFVADEISDGSPVCLVAVSGSELPESAYTLGPEKVGSAELHTSMLEITRDEPSLEVVPFDVTIDVFRLDGS